MEKSTTKIHNSEMINSLISKFRMEDAKVKSENSSVNMTKEPYRELVGSLFYLANTDLIFLSKWDSFLGFWKSRDSTLERS